MNTFPKQKAFAVRFVLQICFVALLICMPVETCFCQEEENVKEAPQFVFRKDAESGAAYRKNHLNFFHKLVRLYSEHTKDPISLQQQAKQYLLSAISFDTGQVHKEDKALKQKSELFTIGKKLLDDGCNDPLVLLFHAKTLNVIDYEWGRNVGLTKQNRPTGFTPNEDPVPVARRAIKAFEKSAYPKGLKILFFRPRNNAFDDESIRGDSKKRIKDDLDVLDAIPAWIEFVKDAPDWQRIAYSVIQRHPMKKGAYRDVHPSKAYQGAKQLVQIKKLGEQKVLSPWLYQMMLADHYNNFPYCNRLASDNVSESYRQKLLAEVPETAKKARRLAAKHYRAAYEISSSRPESAAHLIMLAYEGFESESRFKWFQLAIDAEIDNPSAYYYLLLTSDRMTTQALVAMAYQFFESDRFDTLIPHQFLWCVCKLSWHEHRSLMARDDKVFQTTRDLFINYAEREGVSIEDSMATPRQINSIRSLVKIAANAGRYDVAVQYAQLLDQMSPNWFALTKDKVFLHSMIHAKNNYAAELEDIQFNFEDYGRSNLSQVPAAELANRYDVLAANSDPLSAPFLKMSSILADQYLEYDSGDWVELGCEFPADHLWGIRGNFSGNADGTIDLSNSPKMGQYVGDFFDLSHQGKFKLPREIQCDINLLNWKGNAELGIQGYPAICVFAIKPQFGIAIVEGQRDGKHSRELISIPGLKPRKPVHLMVRVWDKANFQFFVNGVLVDVGDLEMERVSDSLAFLGSSYVHQNSNAENPARPEIAVKLSNVRVRKLDFAPPPKRNQSKVGLEYFTASIAREPAIGYNYLRRADCHDRLNNIEEAISDYRQGLKDDPRLGRDKLRFVQLCLSTGKYAEAHEILYKLLGRLRAAKKVVDVAREPKINGKKKNWGKKKKDKTLVRKTLGDLGFQPTKQLDATIASIEAQLLVLQGTCPDDTIRSVKISKELLKAARIENKEFSALRYLGKAYVQAELKQYDGATKSLNAAKKAAVDSASILAKIQSAKEAIQNRKPIRLEGDQIVVLENTIE